MAEKSKTREIIEKGAWAALAIGFIGLAIYGAAWGVSKLPPIKL